MSRALEAPGRVEVVGLLPKGNGKTTLFGLHSVDHLLSERNAQCYIGAAEVEQAKEMYRFATHFATADPELEDLIAVKRGTREIRSLVDEGFVKVLAADRSASGGKKQAYNPTRFFVDELHAHDNDELYVAGRSAAFKRQGRVATITTAGHDLDGVLGQLRKGLLAMDRDGGVVRTGLRVDDDGELVEDSDGRLTVAVSASGRTVLLEWSCFDEESGHPDDLTDPEVVKLANPASWVTVESIQDALEAPGITPWDFARYRANVWRSEIDSWLEPGVWEACEEEGVSIPPGEDVWLGVDMGRSNDCAAIVAVWPREDGTMVVDGSIYEPTDDQPVGFAEVEQEIRDLCAQWNVQAVAYDPWRLDRSAEMLTNEGVPMVAYPMTNERMAPASEELFEAITRRKVRHNGDRELAAHVRAGHAVRLERGFRLKKDPKAKRKMDALIALVIGHSLAAQRFQVRSVYETRTGPLL